MEENGIKACTDPDLLNPPPEAEKHGPIYRVFDGITTFLAVVSGILLFVVTMMITIAVVLRYFFGQSVAWSTEFAEYFIYLAVVMATPWVLKLDKHVRVDAVINLLGPKTRWVLDIINNFLGILMSLALLYFSYMATYENYVKGTMNIRVTPIPKWIPLVFMPIMAALLIFQFSYKFYCAVKTKGNCPKEQVDLSPDSI